MEFSTGGLLGGHALTIGSGTAAILGDVTQDFPNATISFSGAGNLRLEGAFLNSTNCNFTAGTGTVHYQSTTEAQTIGDFTYYNLTLNNTSGATPPLTLYDDATVSNILTMTAGNINLNGNILSLTNTAATALSHSLASTSGWMYGGSFRRTFSGAAVNINNSSGLFPLGSATEWRPFSVGKGGSGAGTVTVSHNSVGTTSVVSFADSGPPAATIVRRQNSSWTVSTTAATGTWGIRAGGDNFGSIGLVAPSDVSELRMALTGSVVGTHVAATGTTTVPFVNRTVPVADLANTFYLTSTDATDSPLPIQLVDFAATIRNDVVDLSWSTASELNNDFFTIERATNIEEFEVIGLSIDGAGTTRKEKIIEPLMNTRVRQILLPPQTNGLRRQIQLFKCTGR